MIPQKLQVKLKVKLRKLLLSHRIHHDNSLQLVEACMGLICFWTCSKRLLQLLTTCKSVRAAKTAQYEILEQTTSLTVASR